MTHRKVEEISDAISWKLDYHPSQKDGGQVSGIELQKYYEGWEFTGLLFSLEDPLIQLWISSPSTYPEELKGEYVFLWGSKLDYGNSRLAVAFLFWYDGTVIESWQLLDDAFNRDTPALIKGA
jgi:hypothetical protein